MAKSVKHLVSYDRNQPICVPELHLLSSNKTTESTFKPDFLKLGLLQASTKCFAMAQAIPKPSAVEVPRPQSIVCSKNNQFYFLNICKIWGEWESFTILKSPNVFVPNKRITASHVHILPHGRHGLALGILAQFIDDHQRALRGNVENTCSLVSMIPGNGFTGDFQKSNSCNTNLDMELLLTLPFSDHSFFKKDSPRNMLCNCIGYIKLVLVVSPHVVS